MPSAPIRVSHLHPDVSSGGPVELWGGLEATVNRVGDVYFDQSLRNGHHERATDLELIAGLGIRALRYPVLWERTAPAGLDQADWGWLDERLGALRALGVRPIAGLVHHGSGPRHTSLVDPAFPSGLADYARAVAERYPWIDAYTPVNEPLTTARFSGLYGHWYPHGRDELTFARALLNECRAVALAMASIRQINPSARLIQTDDLGRTYSTPRLAYQAAFENERRWLTWDLLCGALDASHPMWDYLRWVGVGESELGWFLEHPCPPDIIGINSYLTSERVLDEYREPYPPDRWGGNTRETYADMEAVRVRAEGIGGWRTLVEETWRRYHLPIALTEVHLGCTREEQLRWLLEAWTTCAWLREQQGVDLRAVTAWSLLGAYDWNHLVTCTHGFYEPGVFDVRAPVPRPTALAGLMQELASGKQPSHPCLDTPGWWRRPDRFTVRPLHTEPLAERPAEVRRTPRAQRPERQLLIAAGDTVLGRAFRGACAGRGLAHCSLTCHELDVSDAASVQRALDTREVWAVISPEYARVSPATTSRDAEPLAQACARGGVRLMTFSSDLVFDGTRAGPYVEGDALAPAEERLLRADPSALIVRTSAVFGGWDGTCLPTWDEVAAADEVLSPTYVPDLVQAALDLLVDGERGIWHLANAGAMTWSELLEHLGRPAPPPVRRLGHHAARARVLSSERGWLMPSLQDAIDRLRAQGQPDPSAGRRAGLDERAA